MQVRHANTEIDGAKLRELRKAAGLSVTQAAERLGMSRGYLSNVEVGRFRTVTPARFNLMCAVYGVGRDVLTPAFAEDAA